MNAAAKFQSVSHERKHFFRKKNLFDRLKKRETEAPGKFNPLYKIQKTRKHQPVFYSPTEKR